MRPVIPYLNLLDLPSGAFYIHAIEPTDIRRMMETDAALTAHRDNYYLFCLVRKGSIRGVVDFKKVAATGAGIFCIFPGQVHQMLEMKNLSGWVLAASTESVPESVRILFDESSTPVNAVKLPKKQQQQLFDCAALITNRFRENDFNHQCPPESLKYLVNGFLCMLAEVFEEEETTSSTTITRAGQLARKFRVLVRKNYRQYKTASDYAALLNIAPVYLSEIVKKVSGMPPTHWIQQEIILEAKRLLFYSELSIRQISDALGYEDHTYFSRFFAKISGLSAQQFRNESRRQSGRNLK